MDENFWQHRSEEVRGVAETLKTPPAKRDMLVIAAAYARLHSNFRSLGRPASLHDRKEVSLASRTTAAAIKLSSLFNRKRHVVDVAFNPR